MKVQQHNYLGIYLSKDNATVAFARQGGSSENIDSFTVSTVSEEEKTPQLLAQMIASECLQHQFDFTEVAIAMDCSMFMQHNLHSKFTDPRQIANTVKFDTEEAIATDVSELGLTFNITRTDETGSALTVFTVQKKVLSELLSTFQGQGMDPVTIEPDIACLARFIATKSDFTGDSNPLYCIFTGNCGYIFTLQTSGLPGIVRTFFLPPAGDRTSLLLTQIPITLAGFTAHGPFDSLKIFDTAGSHDCSRLSDSLSIPTEQIELFGSDIIHAAIADGAAAGLLKKSSHIDFRPGFSPYQGRKMILQKTLKALGISVAVLAVAIGLYFQLQVSITNSYHKRVRGKLQKQYSAVMFGKNLPADSIGSLKRELRRIRDIKSGQLSASGSDSISAKLTFTLEAFNKVASQVDLQIDRVSISPKTITVGGETNSRGSTLKLFEAIKNQPQLEIVQQTYESSKAGRDKFRLTITPKK